MPLKYWNKIHLCGVIAAHFNYRRYLEITTTETGLRFKEAFELGLDACDRLVYLNAANSIHDGLPIKFSARGDDIVDALNDVRALPKAYDIILVDAHHTYDCASRDIRAAFDVLAPGGALIVHDCFPRDKRIASPDYQRGEWCGTTYKAYVDFVLANAKLNYVTVDTDYGCGVILKPRTPFRALKNRLRSRRQRGLQREWRALGDDYERCFDMLQSRSVELLRLGDLALLRQALHV